MSSERGLPTRARMARRTAAAGFTVIEVLVVLLVGIGVLSAFSAFYVAEQRSLGRHRVEIAASEALRTALEQMSRDLRTAGLDPTNANGTAFTFGITSATATEVDFTLDADADGSLGATETKKFRLNGSTLESYQAGSATWVPLADNLSAPSGTVFAYYRCDGTQVTTLPASQADRIATARIDIVLSVSGVGGVTLSRTETESVRLRNKGC